MSDIKELEKRLSDLEAKVAAGGSKPKKERKPRAPSAYNEFMKEYFAKEKKKNPEKTHKELFAEAAKAWTDKKTKD
jgi:hypothetical protein